MDKVREHGSGGAGRRYPACRLKVENIPMEKWAKGMIREITTEQIKWPKKIMKNVRMQVVRKT